jgi:hypothetical protein
MTHQIRRQKHAFAAWRPEELDFSPALQDPASKDSPSAEWKVVIIAIPCRHTGYLVL